MCFSCAHVDITSISHDAASPAATQPFRLTGEYERSGLLTGQSQRSRLLSGQSRLLSGQSRRRGVLPGQSLLSGGVAARLQPADAGGIAQIRQGARPIAAIVYVLATFAARATARRLVAALRSCSCRGRRRRAAAVARRRASLPDLHRRAAAPLHSCSTHHALHAAARRDAMRTRTRMRARYYLPLDGADGGARGRPTADLCRASRRGGRHDCVRSATTVPERRAPRSLRGRAPDDFVTGRRLMDCPPGRCV